MLCFLTLSLNSLIRQYDFSDDWGWVGIMLSICKRKGIPLTPLIREKSVDKQLNLMLILAPTLPFQWNVIRSKYLHSIPCTPFERLMSSVRKLAAQVLNELTAFHTNIDSARSGGVLLLT